MVSIQTIELDDARLGPINFRAEITEADDPHYPLYEVTTKLPDGSSIRISRSQNSFYYQVESLLQTGECVLHVHHQRTTDRYDAVKFFNSMLVLGHGTELEQFAVEAGYMKVTGKEIFFYMSDEDFREDLGHMFPAWPHIFRSHQSL